MIWRLFAIWAFTVVLAIADAVPACTGASDSPYPCAIGGTLEVASPPAGTLFMGGGGGGGGGRGGRPQVTIVNDPVNPGFMYAFSTALTLPGPGQTSFSGTLQLATVTGAASICCL